MICLPTCDIVGFFFKYMYIELTAEAKGGGWGWYSIEASKRTITESKSHKVADLTRVLNWYFKPHKSIYLDLGATGCNV